MTIKYGLRPGSIPAQAGKFIPVVPQETQISFDILISEVAQRAATTEGIVANVMSAYRDLVKQHLLEGKSIFIGDLCRIFLSLKGLLDSAETVSEAVGVPPA